MSAEENVRSMKIHIQLLCYAMLGCFSGEVMGALVSHDKN